MYNSTMQNPASTATNALASIATAAHDHGRRILLLLDAATFSDADKAAWAAVLPQLSLAELDRLEKLLQDNMASQIAHEFEDFFLAAKAAQAKRDLSLAALTLKQA